MMRPAFLGDAALNTRIRFELPATGGGRDTFAGRVTAYDRDKHAVGTCVIRFQLDTTGERVFTCRPNLHIDLHTDTEEN